jgi:hypothetical protein
MVIMLMIIGHEYKRGTFWTMISKRVEGEMRG